MERTRFVVETTHAAVPPEWQGALRDADALRAIAAGEQDPKSAPEVGHWCALEVSMRTTGPYGSLEEQARFAGVCAQRGGAEVTSSRDPADAGAHIATFFRDHHLFAPLVTPRRTAADFLREAQQAARDHALEALEAGDDAFERAQVAFELGGYGQAAPTTAETPSSEQQ
jgi:hypothetical protein